MDQRFFVALIANLEQNNRLQEAQLRELERTRKRYYTRQEAQNVLALTPAQLRSVIDSLGMPRDIQRIPAADLDRIDKAISLS